MAEEVWERLYQCAKKRGDTTKQLTRMLEAAGCEDPAAFIESHESIEAKVHEPPTWRDDFSQDKIWDAFARSFLKDEVPYDVAVALLRTFKCETPEKFLTAAGYTISD